MTSWTAEVEWHAVLGGPGVHDRLLVLKGLDRGRFRWSSDTGTMTATVTLEAPDLLRALEAALLLVRDVTDAQVTVNRVATTQAYYDEVAPPGA